MSEKSGEFIPTRHSLLNRLKDWDDHESWRCFFDTYWKLIYSVSLKAGLSDAEAQDVVQETIVAVAKKMPTFEYRPDGSFKAWLLTITRRNIGHRLRKNQSSAAISASRSDECSRTSTIERVPDPVSQSVDAAWETEWQKNLLVAALESVKRKVPARQYQIFDAYVVKEWPVKRICAALQVSAAQIYLAKFRISALVRKEVKRLESEMG